MPLYQHKAHHGPANSRDLRVLLKLCGEALGSFLEEQVDDAVKVEIRQDGAVSLPFAPSPIIDLGAEWGYRYCPDGWSRIRRSAACGTFMRSFMKSKKA